MSVNRLFPRFLSLLSLRKGQALVEAMIAVSVLLMGFLGIFSLLSQSFGLNRVVSDDYAANYLAAEGIEVIQGLIHENWIANRNWDCGLNDGWYELQFDTTSTTPGPSGGCTGLARLAISEPSQSRPPLRLDQNQNLYNYLTGDPTPFRRAVSLTRVSPGEIKAVSRVSWTGRGGGDFQINLESHLYDWMP